jgi:hypothetical protein
VFDFGMDYEEKIRLFNKGYTFLSAYYKWMWIHSE